MEQNSSREPRSQLAQAGRLQGVVEQRPSGPIEQIEVDVHSIARLGWIQQRRKRCALLMPASDVAHDLFQHDAAVRAREPSGGPHRNLELVRRILGQEALGLRPCFDQRPHHRARERLRATLRLQRERRCRRRVAEQLELVLEAR